MTNTLIERKLYNIQNEMIALEKINPILNKLVDAVITHGNNMDITISNEKLETEQLIRKYIEVDVWDWSSLIVLNVLPKENRKLFNAFKKVFKEQGVMEYKKENDADSKKRKLRAKFNLFNYDAYGNDYEYGYNVDIIFRGDLPSTCTIEYEESYEEIESDDYIVRSGKVLRKEITMNVVCEDSSMLSLPKATA